MFEPLDSLAIRCTLRAMCIDAVFVDRSPLGLDVILRARRGDLVREAPVCVLDVDPAYLNPFVVALERLRDEFDRIEWRARHVFRMRRLAPRGDVPRVAPSRILRRTRQ